MLSAMANLSCALPEESVTSSGCHNSVSGKYLRRRGVKACCSAWTRAEAPLTDLDTIDAEVSTRVASALTSTTSDALPTLSRTSTLVRLDEVTGTAVMMPASNPGT